MATINRCCYCGGFLRHYAVEDQDRNGVSRHIYACLLGLTTLDGIEPCGRAYARDESQRTMREIQCTWIKEEKVRFPECLRSPSSGHNQRLTMKANMQNEKASWVFAREAVSVPGDLEPPPNRTVSSHEEEAQQYRKEEEGQMAHVGAPVSTKEVG